MRHFPTVLRPMCISVTVAVMALAANGALAEAADAPDTAASAATAQPAPEAVSPGLAALMADADRWLLAGQMAPADIMLRLARLEPPERLLAIAYLRRLGIYDRPAVPIDVLLDPARAAP